PASYRIDFKVLLLVYKTLNGFGPAFIRILVILLHRSSAAAFLNTKHSTKKKTGDAAFFSYAPKLWNSLPKDIREAGSVEIFKHHLKTYLFNRAFP
ncbi:hypothetical protein LDENG_00037420, partial [Lucifuga dentata]